MKKLLLTTSALVAFAVVGPANAADLSTPVYKAPIMAPVLWTWTGFYVGGNVGYSWGTGATDFTETSTATSVVTATTTGAPPLPLPGNGATLVTSTSASGSGRADINGWLAGLQTGYNWQVNQWVYGLEGDIQITGEKGDVTLCLTAGCPAGSAIGTASYKLPWFGTFRGRLGFVWDRFLIYGTGGLAVGEVEANYTGGLAGGPLPILSTDSTRFGWVVGAGIEAHLWGHWTAKLEYLYMDLGNVGGSVNGSTGPTITPFGINNADQIHFITTTTALNGSFNTHVTDNILRIGLNYKFDPSPVVARY